MGLFEINRNTGTDFFTVYPTTQPDPFNKFRVVGGPTNPPRGNTLLTTSLIVDMGSGSSQMPATDSAPRQSRGRDRSGKPLFWD